MIYHIELCLEGIKRNKSGDFNNETSTTMVHGQNIAKLPYRKPLI